jgi:hypothetical protein
MTLLAWMLLAAITFQRHEPVDAMELNHVEDRFSQVILWRWNGRRHVPQGWWLVHRLSDVPTRIGDRWHVWHQGTRIVSGVFTESWTVHDRELEARVKR